MFGISFPNSGYPRHTTHKVQNEMLGSKRKKKSDMKLNDQKPLAGITLTWAGK